jgi:hypothetical protein
MGRCTVTMRSVLLASAALAFAAPASASQIFVSNVALSDGSEQVTVAGFGTFNAGRFVLTYNLGNTLNAPTDTFLAWCVDLFRTIGLGPSAITFNVGVGVPDDSATPTPNALSAAQQSRVAGLMAYGNAQLAANPGSSVISAAVQGEIWETINNATATSDNAAVQSLLDTLDTMTFSGGGTVRLTGDPTQGLGNTQHLGGIGGGGDPFEVPAPAALGLFGLALAGLFGARRLRA